MISPDQITTWAAAGESEILEFKRSTGQRREAARTLCAMLSIAAAVCSSVSSPTVAWPASR